MSIHLMLHLCIRLSIRSSAGHMACAPISTSVYPFKYSTHLTISLMVHPYTGLSLRSSATHIPCARNFTSACPFKRPQVRSSVQLFIHLTIYAHKSVQTFTDLLVHSLVRPCISSTFLSTCLPVCSFKSSHVCSSDRLITPLMVQPCNTTICRLLCWPHRMCAQLYAHMPLVCLFIHVCL